MAQVMTCKIKKLGERKSLPTSNQAHSSSSQPQVDRINLYFKHEEVITDTEWSPLNTSSVRSLTRVNSVHVIRPQVMNSESTFQSIKTVLSDWNMLSHSVENLISRMVISNTTEMLKSVSQGNNVLDVYVKFSVCSDRFMRVMQDRGLSGMVPATESSIKSLKRKMVDRENIEHCSICFEEYSSGCEAVCLPCSHEFHGHCIEKWLRTSHYCPMCRYAMPTN